MGALGNPSLRGGEGVIRSDEGCLLVGTEKRVKSGFSWGEGGGWKVKKKG